MQNDPEFAKRSHQPPICTQTHVKMTAEELERINRAKENVNMFKNKKPPRTKEKTQEEIEDEAQALREQIRESQTGLND